MPTVLADTVHRVEVTAIVADATPYLLPFDGAFDLCYSAKVAVAGTSNAIEFTASSHAEVFAGTADWVSLAANVTSTTLTAPTAFVDGTGAPLTFTAVRASRNDQDITLVLLGKRASR